MEGGEDGLKRRREENDAVVDADESGDGDDGDDGNDEEMLQGVDGRKLGEIFIPFFHIIYLQIFYF